MKKLFLYAISCILLTMILLILLRVIKADIIIFIAVQLLVIVQCWILWREMKNRGYSRKDRINKIYNALIFYPGVLRLINEVFKKEVD